MALQGANGNGMDGAVGGGRKPFEKRSKKTVGVGGLNEGELLGKVVESCLGFLNEGTQAQRSWAIHGADVLCEMGSINRVVFLLRKAGILRLWKLHSRIWWYVTYLTKFQPVAPVKDSAVSWQTCSPQKSDDLNHQQPSASSRTFLLPVSRCTTGFCRAAKWWRCNFRMWSWGGGDWSLQPRCLFLGVPVAVDGRCYSL